MVRSALRLVLAAVLVAACDPDSVVEVGLIDTSTIEASVVAVAGDPVFVRFATNGGGCVSVESTETEVTDEGGEVTPYDRSRIPGPGEGCTLILKFLRHEAWFEFDTPGVKTIRIHGRRRVGDGIDPVRDEAIEIPVQITIKQTAMEHAFARDVGLLQSKRRALTDAGVKVLMRGPRGIDDCKANPLANGCM